MAINCGSNKNKGRTVPVGKATGERCNWMERAAPHNEATVYVGIGLIQLLQVQRDFSNAGSRTRIRSDIVLSDNFPFPSTREDAGRFGKGIVISPFIEQGSGRKVHGLGIGVAFD